MGLPRGSLAALFVVTLSVVTGCASDHSDATLGAATAKADVAGSRVDGLEKTVHDLERRLYRLELARSEYSKTTIDPSTKNYGRLDTDVGRLLVICEDVSPYANGYRVSIRIGNVTMATLNGFKLNVSWGRAYGDTTVIGWEAARHESTFDYTEELLPGRWNKVSFVLAPAQSHDLDLVTLGVETDRVSLIQLRDR
jgi:hypothetical protein